MLTLKQKLGYRIKTLRKKAGYSQEQLAEKMGMNAPNLSNIECGKRFMTIETLEKFANALNTTERDLFDFSESEPSKYYRSDIENILNNCDEKDLRFFVDIMRSYMAVKRY